MVVGFLAWFALACLAMCFVEYAVHRWPMHDKALLRKFPWLWPTFESHAVLHHGRFFRVFDDEPDRAGHYVSVELSPWFNLAGLSPVWVPLLFWSVTGGVAFAAVAALHGAVWTAVHREMHGPSGRFFSRWWVFRYLRDYHRTHHEHPGCNFNAVFPPLADLVFGTYRRPR